MKKYETLIFDLDDTLIDNNESIKYAFKMIVEVFGLNFSEELFEQWKIFDTSYWHSWESGQMVIPDTITTLEEKITFLRANRFILFFKNLELDFSTAVKINDLYCRMLGVNIVEIKGARDLLQSLKPDYEILIATNGPKEAAFHKIEKAKLDSYVSSLVASEEIGFSKPMPEYFDFLCNQSQNKDRSKMLLIGDSLTTDILGGMNNDIDTCWFNPNQNPLKEEYKPTMTIHKLLQLKKQL